MEKKGVLIEDTKLEKVLEFLDARAERDLRDAARDGNVLLRLVLSRFLARHIDRGGYHALGIFPCRIRPVLERR